MEYKCIFIIVRTFLEFIVFLQLDKVKMYFTTIKSVAGPMVLLRPFYYHFLYPSKLIVWIYSPCYVKIDSRNLDLFFSNKFFVYGRFEVQILNHQNCCWFYPIWNFANGPTGFFGRSDRNDWRAIFAMELTPWLLSYVWQANWCSIYVQSYVQPSFMFCVWYWIRINNRRLSLN